MRMPPLVVAIAAAALGVLVPAADRADGACAPVLYRQGAPFHGTYPPIPADAVGARVGHALEPQCIDTVPPPPRVPPNRVEVHRVVGVSPRLAVATSPASSRGASLFIRDGILCGSADRLRCLRRLTRLARTGPSLVAPLSADPGTVIRVSVRAPGIAVRPAAAIALQRFTIGRRWEAVARLAVAPEARARPVRLPAVEPGTYRLVRRVTGPGGVTRELSTPIALRGANTPTR